jgi:Fe-S-cluster containining protein
LSDAISNSRFAPRENSAAPANVHASTSQGSWVRKRVMEIAIDFVLVRKLIAQEYRQARAEIATLSPLVAYEHSQRRHDERLATAADAPTLACKAGCSWCCHFTVDLGAVEVLRILDVVATLPTAQQVRVREQVTANSVMLRGLSETERMQRNVKCPFLDAGRCTIYSARPQTCRNYHATDAAGCRKSFEEPDNLDIDPEFAPLVYQCGGAHVEAFSKAMRDAGFDVAAYEMNAALAVALERPEEIRRRFAARMPMLPEVDGAEIPSEFVESDDPRER